MSSASFTARAAASATPSQVGASSTTERSAPSATRTEERNPRFVRSKRTAMSAVAVSTAGSPPPSRTRSVNDAVSGQESAPSERSTLTSACAIRHDPRVTANTTIAPKAARRSLQSTKACYHQWRAAPTLGLHGEPATRDSCRHIRWPVLGPRLGNRKPCELRLRWRSGKPPAQQYQGAAGELTRVHREYSSVVRGAASSGRITVFRFDPSATRIAELIIFAQPELFARWGYPVRID
jgi:hypothetical protein